MIEVIITSPKRVDRLVFTDSYLNIRNAESNEGVVVRTDEHEHEHEITIIGRLRLTVDEALELTRRACNHNDLRREQDGDYCCIRCGMKVGVSP